MSKLIARVVEKRPVQGEVWSQYLQRRVMRLLLLHDQQLFRGQFRAFFAQSAMPTIPLLQFYDRYIRLHILGDELLDEILPDIRRQLSLQTNYEPLLEDVPTRGDIDWPRTIVRAIDETPDQPPLRFDTRLRQQNIANPENLLVVAILLDYRQTVLEALRADIQRETLNEQERLALSGMEERVERELAAPYARLLTEEAGHADIEALIEQVTPHLKPGANPYRNLITWWEHFRDLHIGRTLAQRHLALASKRGDEQLESWLYELWIALETLDLLHESHVIASETMAIESDRLQCLFTWGGRRFRFRYQRHAAPEANTSLGWQGSGTPLSTYAIEREEPLKIAPAGKVLWQEPPVMFAASYSSESNVLAPTQEALQQLLGGMQLAGAHNGGIFSPLLPDPPEGKQQSNAVQPDGTMYTDIHRGVLLYKITPDMARDTLSQRLQAALRDAVEVLPERPAPACYGVLLDRDTVNASRKPAHTGNVLCPKPHIGPGVFDLVDDKLHCLKDPRLCHVYGQPITPPFVIRADTLNGLEQQNADLRARTEERLHEAENASDETRAEQLRSHIFLDVGRAVERYVQIHGNTASLEALFEHWIFGDYWKKHPRCLSETTRNNLLSGEYVWEEYTRTKGLNDWAAPAIQYCRALEGEINRRLHDYYPNPHKSYADVGQKGFSREMTLGFLTAVYSLQKKDPFSVPPSKEREDIRKAKDDWRLCQEILRHAGCNIADFEDIIKRMDMEGIPKKRNKLAHGEAVLQGDAQALRDAIIGHKGEPGILIWLAENLEPHM